MATDNVTTITKSLNYLKVLSIIVMLWFIVVFSVERLEINGDSVINFPNSTYIVTVTIGLLFLIFPNLQRLSFWLVFAMILGMEVGLYYLLKQSNFSPTIFVIQLALHFATLRLMRSLSINLHRVDNTFAN